MAATASAATLSTRLYSYPPFWTKNPFGPWTLAIATAIVATTNRPASGVSNPSRNRNPAASSPPTASAAQTRAGRNPRLPTKPVVRASPGPPASSAAWGSARPERLLRAVAQEDGPEDQPQRQHSKIEHCTPPQNVSKSRYLTSNNSGNNVPCVGVPRVS